MDSQLIIFDLDGTLIDSRADLTAGINHMREQYGLEPLSLETVSGYIGDGVRKLVERSLQGADVDVDDALAINKEYYVSHSTVHTSLYEGVETGLKELAGAGHTLAVLTNKPGDPSRAILKHFGLDSLFTVIIGGGDVPNLKPAPDGIFRCLELAGAESSKVWMVGDHHTDLAVAKNAGVRSALVEYGFGHAADYKPDAQFASFADLVGYFV
ncbi:HAD-IA family hydrolase [Pontiellaceae bacterium B1224]|nr:HAD-IA family hydrolase [Pontiellaceae bacterium B1224]